MNYPKYVDIYKSIQNDETVIIIVLSGVSLDTLIDFEYKDLTFRLDEKHVILNDKASRTGIHPELVFEPIKEKGYYAARIGWVTKERKITN